MPSTVVQQDAPPILNWDVAAVVAELKELRNASLTLRKRLERPAKLPSRQSLISIIAGLNAVLFPNRLGHRELTHESVDFFVGRTLDVSLRELYEQVLRELIYSCDSAENIDRQPQAAVAIVGKFARQLPEIRSLLEDDILAAYEADPTARSSDEILACHSGIHAIVHYRIAAALYRTGVPLNARIIAEIGHSSTGCDIHPGARIGGSFYIPHGTGLVIGKTAIIGRRVRIYQGVTLAAESTLPSEAREPIDHGRQLHPILEDDVIVNAGSTLVGPITIGNGSRIGGNVWLTQSVPPNSNIVQAESDIQLSALEPGNF